MLPLELSAWKMIPLYYWYLHSNLSSHDLMVCDAINRSSKCWHRSSLIHTHPLFDLTSCTCREGNQGEFSCVALIASNHYTPKEATNFLLLKNWKSIFIIANIDTGQCITLKLPLINDIQYGTHVEQIGQHTRTHTYMHNYNSRVHKGYIELNQTNNYNSESSCTCDTRRQVCDEIAQVI